ncbi:transposase [Lentzea sp. BCCO 10_0798]|uniref:Transposase n=1 Tax=Lentzea kristufekii TaxID=3095430 RepID=A0ABU4TNG2_9PSEU|nr:transposase [Lentzea sp. BCCO 10_0798]MDX8049811.1 transposase [Lentzea sp. BCCO 10_0798]
MKIVVRLKLLPDAEQASALAATLHACNQAADEVSRMAFERRVFSRQALQRLAYACLKARGLSAQPALHVIRKTADACTTLHANIRNGNLGPEGSKRRVKAESKPIGFRLDAAQPFDDRCLSWNHDARTVSIWTTAGRMKNLRFTGSPDQLTMLREHRRGETDLVHHDGMWFLIATCDIAEPETFEPSGWLGIDLGIVNVATTSDGDRAAGRRVNRYRRHLQRLRQKLQRKKTKSAKRTLKRLRRRESRHVANTNHVLSKQYVTTAQRTGRGIGLEDLAGIRDRARLRKPQRVVLNSWAFHQLGAFITYKAQRAGVPVQFVDPRNTSRGCSECGHIDKRNRPSQARFVCRSCRYTANADYNASRNISHKADVAWNAGRQSAAPTAA